ncbi:MAG: ThuA domain-containing protein [Pirellulaceae bacterium]|nr:ThuA domain-containing protein [Pirellulaceae bacterium]
MFASGLLAAVVVLVDLFATGFALPAAASAEEVPRILFLTQSKGFTHGSVRRKEGTRAPAELAMLQLAKDTGAFTVYCSLNAEADITRENLQKYDIVAFYTTGKLPIAEEDANYLLNDWLHQKGHGFIGFHSATDTYKDFEPYWDMIGGTFDGHPWGAGSKITVEVHDPDHPTMKPFGQSFEFQDEIYQYRNWQPEKVHVLMSINMAQTQTKRPYHVPIAWCKQIGQGRMFYNNLGHREETWQDQRFLDSIVAAVRWVTGEIDGDATPNPEVSKAYDEASRQAAKLAGITRNSLEQDKKRQAAQRRARQQAEAKAAKEAAAN